MKVPLQAVKCTLTREGRWNKSNAPRFGPAARSESILAAATRTFLAGGFGAVSMDTIAREAGVSKATVYAHFAGKEELFGAMVGRVCERHFETFSARRTRPHRCPRLVDDARPAFSRSRPFPRRDRGSPDHRRAKSPDFRRSARYSGAPARSAPCARSRPSCAERPPRGHSKSRSRAWRPSNSSG